MNLEEIFTFENLYNAHKHCRNSKQHKGEVIRFEVDLYKNLVNMTRELQNREYKFGKYKKFYIYEPKQRLIEALPYKDRVAIRCYCDCVVIPKLEKRLILDNVACRVGKGTLFGMNRLEFFLRNEYRKNNDNNIYYLKCDIRKYFPSINHEILVEKLKKSGFSKDEMWFAKKLLESQPDFTKVGLALGNQSSQWFALFYLNTVDRLIKEKLIIKGYVRYMDDLILIHRDKQYLRMCKIEIEKVCNNELKLSLNDKTQIGRVANGIDFIGFRHILTSKGKVIRKLRKSSKIRLKRHLKALEKLESKNLVDADYVRIRKNAYYAHILYSNEMRLKKSLHTNLSKPILKKQEL